MLDLELIDTRALLDAEGIEYADKGKNVSKGWLGIECPFPGCLDPSNHCGINLSTNLFSCWSCQKKGSIIHLIQEIKKISYRKAEDIARKHTRDIYAQVREDNLPQLNVGSQIYRNIAWPSPIVDFPQDTHRRYLKSRGFDTDFLTKKYKLRFTPNVGKYRFCIIAPIINSGKSVSWIAADVIRDDRPPYTKCPNQSSILPANSCLYNIDSVEKSVVIVEGITDVWRCGDGFVATMTKSITPEQVLLLVQKNVKKVFVMYDADALNEAKTVAGKLSGLFETEVVELSEGDPADFSGLEVAEARRLLIL